MSQCLLHVNNKHQKLIAENQTELDEIFGDLKKMRERANTPEGFSKRVKEYLKEIHEDKIKEEANQVLNMIKTDSNSRRVMEMRKAGVPVADAIQSFLTPSTHNVDNGGVSVAPIMNKQTVKYTNIIEQNTTHAEKKILAKGLLDEEIILDMAGGTKADGDVNPTSKKMSGIFRKILDMTHADKNNTGIIVNKIQNYVFNQTTLHNVEKMRGMGKEFEVDGIKTNEWIEMQMKDLDHAKSFPDMNTDAEKRAYLKDVYDGALTREDEAAVTNWEALKDKGILSSSVQAKYAKPRTLHYTPEGLVNQFKNFSDKSLTEIMISEIGKSSRDVANHEVFGPRGTVALDTIVQKTLRTLQEEFHAATDPKIKDSLQGEIDSINKAKKGYIARIAQINNTNNRVHSKGAKDAWEFGRTLVNTEILGNVPLAAVTDLAWGVSAQQVNSNRGYFHATGKLIKSIVDNVPLNRRQEVITRMRVAQESMLGHMMRVEGSDTFLSRASAKLNYFYSTVLPVQWQTRLHRSWSANIIGMDMADMSAKNFADLNHHEAQGFKKAGILEHDWEAVRATVEDLGPEYKNAKMASSEGIANISDEVAMAAIKAHKAADPRFQPKTPAQYKAHLEKRMDAYIEDYMRTAVPMPGEDARAILHGVGEAGEAGHEALKTLTMLKSFMVHQIHLMQKVSRASPNKGDKARHLSGVAMGLITMAYGRHCIENLMTGEDMPDPLSFDVAKRAVLRSGVSSMVGDVVGQDSYGGTFNGAVSFVAGPAVAKVNDAIGLGIKLASGSAKEKDLNRAAKFVPGNNLMYFKLLNHHILEDAKAAMED